METLSEKSALQLVPVQIEIAGLKKKKKKMKNNDDTKIVKSRMSELLRGELKVLMRSLGRFIARYGPVDYY